MIITYAANKVICQYNSMSNLKRFLFEQKILIWQKVQCEFLCTSIKINVESINSSSPRNWTTAWLIKCLGGKARPAWKRLRVTQASIQLHWLENLPSLKLRTWIFRYCFDLERFRPSTLIAFPLPTELSDRKLCFAENMSLQTLQTSTLQKVSNNHSFF